jgi:predicted nucleotidyltransferase
MIGMGKVFSWEEIVAGEVPKLEDFGIVQRQIVSELEENNEIIGGVICGSVVRGDHNVRSDVDCLVVHSGQNVPRIIGLLQELNKYAKQLYVPVEFIPVDIRVAHIPTVEISFGMHLDWSARNGGCIKTNPIPMLSFDLDMGQELQNYVRLKLNKLTKRWIKYPEASPEHRFHFLQKILEAPVYIARKIIRWQGVDISFDDSKRRIVELYSEHFNGSESSEFFREAVITDVDYTAKLLQQLKCSDEMEYSSVLKEIEAIVPNVLEFIRLVTILANK